MMTAEEVKIAAVTSFYRFCRERNLPAASVTDEAKMAWHAAFVEGAHWWKEKNIEADIKARQQQHEETMRALINDGHGG